MRNLDTIKGLLGVAMASLLLFSSTAFAQQRVTGRVTDPNTQPLAGVSVVVMGTTLGATTDAGGNFAVTVPENRKNLVFSFLGYKSDTINIANRTILKVTLHEMAEEIEEVVVVGFGTMRRVDIGGAVTSVKIDENEATQVTSLDQLLKGRSVGVQVTSDNAAPGSAVSILVRGAGSFNSSTEPLYVVDGVMLNPPGSDMGNASTTGVNIGNEEQNGLLGISPQDIASMEILKDASATAIYGSLGANGVVLITTKQGTSAKPTVTYNGSLIISTPANKIDVLSFDEYREFRNATDNPTYDTYTPMDWQDWYRSTVISQKHRLTISGRDKTTNYYVAGGYAQNKGIMKDTGTEITDFRFNFSKNVGKFVKISTNNMMSYGKYQMTASTDPMQQLNTSVVRSIVSYRPYLMANELWWDEDIDDETLAVAAGSPYAWSQDHSDNTNEYRVNSSLTVDVQLLKWLKYQLKLGIDYRDKTREKWYGNRLYGGRNKKGYVNKNTNSTVRYNMDHMFLFNKTFKKVHKLSGTLGMQITETNTETAGYEVSNIFDQGLQTESYNSALTYWLPQYNEGKNSLLSFFIRASYSYRDKYVLTGTFRVDGSSKFAPGNKFSYFPSFSFAWRINQEQAFNLPTQISNLKLRLGWGRVGNQAIGNYQTLDIYGRSNYYSTGTTSGYRPGYAPGYLPNRDLIWETTDQWNVGLDMGFWNNRVNIVMDLYSKSTIDLLQTESIPPSTGYRTWWANRGEINNKGLELSLDATVLDIKGFTWNVGGNISFNRNKIVDIGIPATEGERYIYFLGNNVGGSSQFSQPANIYIQGKPMGLFWGFKTAGIVQTWDKNVPAFNIPSGQTQGGQVYYVDYNGDGKLDLEDCQIIGDPNPDFTYGFSTNFSYKGITLSAVFNGVQGNDIVNANLMWEWYTGTTGPTTNNLRKEAYYRAWTETNTNTTFPKVTGDADNYKYFSDRLVRDGSFLRLANVTLSYKIPLKKVKAIRSINVSVAANNLFVWTKYNGWDPEVNSFRSVGSLRQGIDFNSYPKEKSYIFGLGLTF